MNSLDQYKDQIARRLQIAQELVTNAISKENVDLVVDNVLQRCQELSEIYVEHGPR